ncbi:hypothetical protein CBER1_11466 [Cercospora berteroae]|uniref:Uncharacterized protein n=1 Tax=Cercospora berteroae TaxID=357750 RepID=A0A2S6CE18_9PEZI|nr:hypothetical protein CBER1_11466 [Cercospora berteroae]
MYGDIDTMAELYLFDLTGHDPDACDIDGHNAESLFDRYNDNLPPKEEFGGAGDRREAWEMLLKKARKQNPPQKMEELHSSDGEPDDDSESLQDSDKLDDFNEKDYSMPGSFDTA